MTSIERFLNAPVSRDEYDKAWSKFIGEPEDFDKLSIVVSLSDVVCKAICDYYGEPYFEDDYDSSEFHLATVVVSALIKTGLIGERTFQIVDGELTVGA